MGSFHLPRRPRFGYTDIMSKSIKVQPKRPGRPATGRDPLIGVRLPPDMIQAIDAWATARAVNRSEAVRRLIAAALADKER